MTTRTLCRGLTQQALRVPSTAKQIVPTTFAARGIHNVTLPWPSSQHQSVLRQEVTYKARLGYLEPIIEKQSQQLLLQGEVIKELKRVIMKGGFTKGQRKGDGMMELLGSKEGQKERWDPL